MFFILCLILFSSDCFASCLENESYIDENSIITEKFDMDGGISLSGLYIDTSSITDDIIKTLDEKMIDIECLKDSRIYPFVNDIILFYNVYEKLFPHEIGYIMSSISENGQIYNVNGGKFYFEWMKLIKLLKDARNIDYTDDITNILVKRKK